MENIALPSKRLNSVQEMMVIFEKVRQECGKNYNIIAHNLHIAKPAMSIQEKESPKIDKLCIEIGPFSSECCTFLVMATLLPALDWTKSFAMVMYLVLTHCLVSCRVNILIAVSKSTSLCCPF